jgi:uncharacterized protein YtpQ (UPF0354 family)
LRNVWGLCQRVPERCDLAIDDFVGHYSGAMREEDGPVTRADLRAVVRTEGYVEELRQVAANKPDAAVIARKLAGDLWLICVVDRADGVELLNMGTIAKLHLSADDAISTALDNVEQSLPPMAKQKTKLLRGKVTVISGDFYNSSRILLNDSWRRIAKRMHGDLIVAVPGTDLLVYGKSETAEDTQALRTVVALIAQQAHRQISLTLLRWTETGWDVVAP